jgi:hypothetical protein
MTMKLPLGFAAFALATAFAPLALAQNDSNPASPVTPVGGSVTVTPGSTESATAPAAAPAEKKDEPSGNAKPEEEKEKKLNPFRGSMFLFDQSIFTSNLSKGGQLSYSPIYEWWVSPRIYYSINEHIKFGARFDFFKEMFTNHETGYAGAQDTRQWRWGDPWLTASYGSKIDLKKFGGNEKSRWSVGVIGRPPMSKESQANGQYFAGGPNASFTYGFDIAKGSKWFSGASVGVSASYSHAFTKSTTPNSFTDFTQQRTDASGDAYLDNQVRSGTLAGNTLLYAFNADLDIYENLSFSGSMIFIDQFAYKSPDVAFGGQQIAHSPNDTQFRQLTWFLIDLDYAVIPELTLSLGYYNLNSSIAPDGTRRNVLWSPESRLFFSLTANLDSIYEDISGTGKKSNTTTGKAKTSSLGIF